jgi:energy-coupling factor transporter transmembrane protein EcfT
MVDEKLDDTPIDDQKVPPRKKKSPFLALILSLFIPGLGNVYTGQVNLGIVTFVGFIVCGMITTSSHIPLLFLIFLFLTIIFWLTSMAVAFSTAVKINNDESTHDIAFFPKKPVSKP